MEDTQIPEKMETSVISRGGESIAEVRGEVGKLFDQVAALLVEDDGPKVDGINFLDLSEKILMQVLKADRIKAERGITRKRNMEIGQIIKFWQISAENGQYGHAYTSWKPKLEEWKRIN